MGELRYLDLFCGMGSFHYGFRAQGWSCIGACDIDPHCRNTYRHHSGIEPHDDVTTLRGSSFPPYELLCAGFPCQAFSMTGLRKGFDDPRGRLVFHVFRLIRETRPPLLVLENVPGLVSHDNGRTFRTILDTLRKMGYDVAWDVWAANEFGLPQTRKRVFVVGVHRNGSIRFDPSDVFCVNRYKKRRTLTDLFGKPFERDFAHTVRTTGQNGKPDSTFTWDWYKLRGGGSYRLTIEDCLRLQGFPASYRLIGPKTYQRRMVGNTIPTAFTRLLGRRIAACLKTSSSRKKPARTRTKT